MTSPVTLRERLQQYRYAEAKSPIRRSSRLIIDDNKDDEGQETPSPRPVKRLRTTDHLRSTPPPIDKISDFTPLPSPSRKHRNTPRQSSKYAAPSRYAHLAPLVDVLAPNLLLVFVGVNPGIQTAVSGHAYAHPSNRFWHLLHASGLTPERKLSPTEDRDLPQLYAYGNTNIVERPTRDQGELSKEEMVAGAAVLDEKFRKCRPEAVCIVGKGIWEAIWKWKHGRNISKTEFKYGWQDDKENMGCEEKGRDPRNDDHAGWSGARVFVATSTSGQAAFLKPEEKLAIWQPLGRWAQERRKERIAAGIFTGTVGADSVSARQEDGSPIITSPG